MLAAFPHGQVGIGRRIPAGVDLVAFEDADLAGGAVHDSGMLHAVDRDSARRGYAVRGTVVAHFHAVLFEPRDSEAGIGVEFAPDSAQILVKLAVDELQSCLHGHQAVVGFQHGLVAAEDAHARADSGLGHIGRGNIGLLQFHNCRRQFSFEGLR